MTLQISIYHRSKCEEEIRQDLNDIKLWGKRFHLTHVETGNISLGTSWVSLGRVVLALGLIINQIVCLQYPVSLSSVIPT